ncbi:S-layer homology domain-containing protein [Cohnella algarum]|uniref:S-layer homology domain-containing protein n=1 Tax=Cohnella algarum TaxID=2044859 RepID=UPI001967327D|nr:S-layer homology domain-containing protein [Cohnella algarum]
MTVTAKSDNPAYTDSEASEPETYTVPEPATPLAKPVVDLTGDDLTWEAVTNADKYEVAIELEDGTSRTVEVTGTSVDLSTLDPALQPGTYTVTVTAKSDNPAYTDSEASEPETYTVPEPATPLAKPVVDLTGDDLTWEAVANADKYEVTIEFEDGTTRTVEVTTGTSVDLSTLDPALQPGTYTVTVTAKSDNPAYTDSEASEPETYTVDQPTEPAVDKTALKAKVTEINEENLQAEGYTQESWQALQDAMEAAQTVLNNEDATQAEVDAALEALTAAREALEEVVQTPVVDKSALQAEADRADDLNEAEYTTASWTNYQAKLTEAQAVLNNEGATQAEVDAALAALQAARQALTLKSGLVAIVPSTGTIEPSVAAGVYDYAMSVDYSVSELQFTLTAAHPEATIAVNGKAATSGQAGDPIALNVGSNVVTVVVKEKDGSEKTYTITVTRQAAPVVSVPSPSPSVEKITVNVEASGHGVVAQTEIERTTNTDGTKSDKVTFTTNKAIEAVDKTLAANAPAVRIVIPDQQDVVKDVRVELPDAALKAVQDAGLDLEIYTDNGMITIPNASLAGINPNLYFHLVPIKQESERKQVEERARTEQIVRQILNNGNVYVVDRPMTIETNMTSRSVNITLPMNDSHVPASPAAREAYLSNLVIFIEHSDGERKVVKPEIGEYAEGKLGLTFTIEKFSTFTILNLNDGANGTLGNGIEGSYHSAYMIGLPDGTFGPTVALTRAQVATILYRVLDLQAADATMSYPDVKATHWAAEAIRQVTKAGLMEGMPDGSFQPEKEITRAEMAVIIGRWKALAGESEHGFADVGGHWAEEMIGKVYQAGYMEGMPDGSFQPNKVLTRAEGVTVFNRVLERGPLYGVEASWSDVPASHWAFHHIEEASRDHYFTSRPEGGETIVE